MTAIDALAKFGWAMSMALTLLIGLIVSNLKKSFATKDDFSRVEARLVRVEADLEGYPRPEELHRDITLVAKRLEGVEAVSKALHHSMEQRLGRIESTLDMLVEKELKA